MFKNAKGLTGFEFLACMAVMGLALLAFASLLKATVRVEPSLVPPPQPPVQVRVTELGFRTIFRGMAVANSDIAQIVVCRDDVPKEAECKPDDVLHVDTKAEYAKFRGARVFVVQVDPRTDFTMRYYVNVNRGVQLPAMSPGPYM